ncbi:hypothetical protein YC2023_072665 [Brassica napus]
MVRKCCSEDFQIFLYMPQNGYTWIIYINHHQQTKATTEDIMYRNHVQEGTESDS